MARRFTPRRALGRTGFVATALGAGDLADRSVPKERCVATLRRALDAGLNVVDTAPMYEDGYSEEIVGEALRGRRAGVLLVDKIDHLDRPVAPQLDESLRRLDVASVDLLVLHSCSEPEAWRRAKAPGGAMAELAEEIARGRARFRGISSHHPDVLADALASGLCDVVMFPVGPYCHPRYVDEILPAAKARGVGTVCFKTFGAGKLVGDTEGYGRPLAQRPRGKVSSGGADTAAPALPRLSVEECLRYTLTLDPDVALLGLSFPNEQDAAFAAAEGFRPMSADERADTRRRAAEAIRGKGEVWWDPRPAREP
ncbi:MULTISPECIES: aldo/keto reductase [Anaeromyxobacter]|uniref:aldo/keto reductase n=1 Tax=Anaeromyxobacter TaxID=161492 RepID=UPI001F5A22FF|nr:MULTISPECIES: aldo/keto reductase [unclassified Anaeromyxobacter]